MIDLVKSIRRQLEADTGVIIIRADTVGKVPAKPYATYKITADRSGKGRENITHQAKEDVLHETRVEERNVSISITVYGSSVDNALELTNKLRKWFIYEGFDYVESINVAIASVSDVQNRTAFLVDAFDEKFGFDVSVRYLDIDERKVNYYDRI